MHYDIFNGDADGIFALHQYRLKFPVEASRKVTGVKRDVRLLSQVEDVTNSELAVFDVSLDSNREPLTKILAGGNKVHYFDHHFAGELPDSTSLHATINPSPDTCTSLIVHELVEGNYWMWAICGAFGDNQHIPATRIAQNNDLSSEITNKLKELGELFNYNGYGADIDDLHFHPEELYHAISSYENPLDFIESSSELVALRSGYNEDMVLALEQKQMNIPGKNRIYTFPDKAWSRRVSGVFSNMKAREKTGSAHAIITENHDGTLRISVRAPLDDKRDADTLCKAFPTGGGRAAAAGINNLPEKQLETFIESFQKLYQS